MISFPPYYAFCNYADELIKLCQRLRTNIPGRWARWYPEIIIIKRWNCNIDFWDI